MTATPTIQALPTIYKGHEFRSRLEARWAIFFDCMGWKWEYEPEAVQTRHGGYLVDFRLHGFEYAEIKPEEFSAEELEKAADACVQFKAVVTLHSGLPHFPPYKYIRPFGADDDAVKMIDGPFGKSVVGQTNFYTRDQAAHVKLTEKFRAAVHASHTAKFNNGELVYLAGGRRIKKLVGLH